MSHYDDLKGKISKESKTWLITGVAGFIGSNLLETLLKLDQRVVGLDNFSTGHQRNLEEVESQVSSDRWARFHFINGDIRDYESCALALKNVDYVLHQAALGSVPRSIADPITSNAVNVTGFLNMLHAAKEEGVSSFTYAASSSTYGDHPALPKIEQNIGNPLSPYAVTKYVNELYASVYARTYGFKTIGLRYFNVFGKRQDPNGPYAAVIPKWISAAINGDEVHINGDGETSRDFCFIENVVQMNLLAAISDTAARDEVYNVAVGDRTSLKELFGYIVENLENSDISVKSKVIYRDFRPGDVRHSQASIGKAKKNLGYCPTFKIRDGLKEGIKWYLSNQPK